MKTLILLLLLMPSLLFAFELPSSFEANIVQIHKSLVTSKEKVTKGTISYKAPSSIRYAVTSPSPSVLVSNSKQSWYYTPPFIEGEWGEVKILPAKKNGLALFFTSLRGGLKKNRLFSVKFEGFKATIYFTKEGTVETSLQKAVLNFKSSKMDLGELVDIDLSYPDGNPVKLIFETMNLKPKFTPETFNFRIPPNTHIKE